MIIKNLDELIFAVSYHDIDKFHMFMRDFKSRPEIFEKYADFLCERINLEKDFLNAFDFFVYVPSTDLQRTNYSQKLVRHLSQKLNKPLKDGILKKIKITKELKTLPREERHKEIEDSFTALLNGGERICIVDDVTASGATLGEISKALKQSGALHVSAAVIAAYNPR
jgi:predicted amidophosphoribosyltransferase